MSTIDAIIEGIRLGAGADFAFVLSRRGRVVVRTGSGEIPEAGRDRLMREVKALDAGTTGLNEVWVPRDQLVGDGDSAPALVFLAIAGEQAIVCIVMPSWADRKKVAAALDAGIGKLEPVLSNAAKARTKAAKKREPSAPPPARKTNRPAAKKKGKGAMSGLVRLTESGAKASPALKHAPAIADGPPLGFSRHGESLPEITIGATKLGRETLAAIETEQIDEIARRAGSMPDIRVELASIGRATQLELQHEEAQRRQSLVSATVPDPLVAPAASRATMPWVEAPLDTKRAVDAARAGRKLAAPKVSVKLEDADDDVLEALLLDGDLANAEGDPPPPPERPAKPAGGRKGGKGRR